MPQLTVIKGFDALVSGICLKLLSEYYILGKLQAFFMLHCHAGVAFVLPGGDDIVF